MPGYAQMSVSPISPALPGHEPGVCPGVLHTPFLISPELFSPHAHTRTHTHTHTHTHTRTHTGARTHTHTHTSYSATLLTHICPKWYNAVTNKNNLHTIIHI